MDNELITLQEYRDDAVEQFEENERVINSQAARIKQLEKVVRYFRTHIYDMYRNTIDVVPIEYVADEKPNKSVIKKGIS